MPPHTAAPAPSPTVVLGSRLSPCSQAPVGSVFGFCGCGQLWWEHTGTRFTAGLGLRATGRHEEAHSSHTGTINQALRWNSRNQDTSSKPPIDWRYLMRTPALVLLALFLPGIAHAQVIPLGPNPTNPVIGGLPVSCSGVPAFVNHQLGDIAYAYPGSIHFSPGFFSLPPPTQVFIYAHECAHQISGIGSNEQSADCWAVKTGRNQGWLNQDSLSVVMAGIVSSAGDWTHLPGPYRIAQMQACFDLYP